MTSDIEQQRPDFESYYRSKYPTVCSFDPWKFYLDDRGDYRDGGVYVAFEVWRDLRAVQGSAEPVAVTLPDAIGLIKKGLDPLRKEFSEHKVPGQAIIDAMKRSQFNLTAAPAPVSAEPGQGFWDWLPLAYGDAGKGGQSCFTKFNMEVAFHAGRQSATPSKDAKEL